MFARSLLSLPRKVRQQAAVANEDCSVLEEDLILQDFYPRSLAWVVDLQTTLEIFNEVLLLKNTKILPERMSTHISMLHLEVWVDQPALACLE